jgi:spermidine/putrescine transport system permease protein
MIRRSGRPSWPLAFVVLSLAFMYAPLLVIALMSFNASTVPTLPIEGFTFGWYQDLVNDQRFVRASIFTLKVAAVSTAISVVLGTAAALAIALRTTFPYRAAAGLYVLPLLVPTLVLSVAMAAFLRLVEVRLSFWTVVAGHVVVNAPLIYLVVAARLRGFDWSLVQAARTLGANPRQAFMRITAPLLAPAVAGGAILAFAISIDNFIVTLFLTGGESTLPLLIWSSMRAGFSPSVNALATVLVVGTLAAAVVAERLTARAARL